MAEGFVLIPPCKLQLIMSWAKVIKVYDLMGTSTKFALIIIMTGGPVQKFP